MQRRPDEPTGKPGEPGKIHESGRASESSDPGKPGEPRPAEEVSRPRPKESIAVLSFRGTDQELLERLHREGSGAAGLLYDRFAEEVNGLVWRLLGPDADREDIVQGVFYRLLKHVGRVRDADKLASWVRSIVVNTVYSELRKRKVRRLFFATESLEPEQFFDARVSVESRDLLSKVYGEMDRMSVADRLAFSLRYIEGKQLSEVAELCGCSLATIKRRIQRAESLLEHLREEAV